jgi:hypothetical protein
VAEERDVDVEILGLQDEEEDALFKIQMWFSNFFLGHWKQLLATLGVVLCISLGFGIWQGKVVDAQQDIAARVAKIDQGLPAGAMLSGEGTADAFARAAAAYEEVARGGDGAQAIYAWVRAGSAWTHAGEVAKAAVAYEAGVAIGGTSIVGWSATSGLAQAKAALDDVDGAISVYLPVAAGADVIAQQALFEVGMLQLGSGRRADAIATFQDFSTRFADSWLQLQVADALAQAHSGTEG